jgi:hypothetical protein
MLARFFLFLFVPVASLECAISTRGDEPNYDREIRPILANYCFACHGPDEEHRAADLRLDAAATALADNGNGPAITPGDPDSSPLMNRILATDPDMRMPPPEFEKSLSSEQVALLHRWIAGGAQYSEHWAFQPLSTQINADPISPSWPIPVTASTPAVPGNSPLQAASQIDAFVQARLASQQLQPSPVADRSTLIRRVYLDLLGILPTRSEVEHFLQDQRIDAYERMLETALADPHFGERWGRHWLDQARYADSNGYSVDGDRAMYAYRHWVLNALNDDMPFDQFTIEQLAGDLLPNPSQSQLIATGFHRNTLINEEGGVDAEQFRVESVVDRVNTTASVWLGLTLGCAQCHNHKYDPISQREYYQFYAFFNSSADVNGASPTLPLPSPEQTTQLQELDQAIIAMRQLLADAPSDQSPQLQERLAELEKQKKSLQSSIPTTMILRELPQPRPTYVLIRGDFLRLGEPVSPATPTAVSASMMPQSHSARINDPSTQESPVANRLQLALWLVDQNNPLTARVTVNRVWARLFGRGFVETENDFGLQGTPPTHPELLDTLAFQFMSNDWSLKHLLRSIMLSHTYQQSSRRSETQSGRDPLNIWLSRQSRLRVEAEIVRDVTLSCSGLLDQRLGGPSVYPPQPDGIYAFTQRAQKWPTSHNGDRYRRGLYTFFKRSAPYPMLTTFDAPRLDAVCTIRSRSNTPLQSLTQANDQAALEAAIAFANRLLVHPANSNVNELDTSLLNTAFLIALSRSPEPPEAEQLIQFLNAQRQYFRSNPQASAALLLQCAGPSDGELAKALIQANHDPVELASWLMLARLLLNLDEFVTRE